MYMYITQLPGGTNDLMFLLFNAGSQGFYWGPGHAEQAPESS